jgi:D-beta-D-heptose 7-phosphate kinase/D-beta-D-heptose 1-phosphate adenosyltransferase
MTESKNIPQQKLFKILLIGDNCTDTYVYGTVDRISPEAPVPIFVPHSEIVKAGMGGNVAKNLEELGCSVNFLHGKSSQKQRLIDERSKQQLLRIDVDATSDPITIDSELPPYDAIVISDYNKGAVSYELIEDLRSRFDGPIFVDTKKTDLARFNGCYVKINELEKKRAVSLPDDKWLIVTYGSKGAVWNNWAFPAEIVGDVTDVTGAGDTFLAAFAYEFLIQEYVQAAIKFAIKASSITVQHVGVYAPRLEEIK